MTLGRDVGVQSLFLCRVFSLCPSPLRSSISTPPAQPHLKIIGDHSGHSGLCLDSSGKEPLAVGGLLNTASGVPGSSSGKSNFAKHRHCSMWQILSLEEVFILHRCFAIQTSSSNSLNSRRSIDSLREGEAMGFSSISSEFDKGVTILVVRTKGWRRVGDLERWYGCLCHS